MFQNQMNALNKILLPFFIYTNLDNTTYHKLSSVRIFEKMHHRDVSKLLLINNEDSWRGTHGQDERISFATKTFKLPLFSLLKSP